MALPNGAGGYQLGDGNLSEVNIGVQATPTSKAAAATLTAAELTNGIIIYSGATASLTLPTVADTEALVSSAKTNSSFEVNFINTGAGTLTVAAGTGWTLVGTATSATATSAAWRARKTGDGAWTLYRIA
ncbi:hypothetical protein UFOVP162_26 [uncultured Caudovirales phage]|uniref:Uncharacterized protein n=1 Tax=uncultured Caudovirales phage TaxID=2100421 RepID=A0A6J7XP60_9CAUD|nr:hypothetical protein UFOVP162_26 [uncultured Caudovirales phage]